MLYVTFIFARLFCLFDAGKLNQIISTYALRSSRISRKSAALIVRYSQKKECISFVLYCFNFGTTGPIQVGFSALKCTSGNEDFKQIEN